jgi:hypothetical protein
MKGPDHPWIDSSHAPVFIWRFPGEFTDEELAAVCAARERWAKLAPGSCAWVVDLTHILRVPQAQRSYFVEHLKRFEPHDVKYNRGSALIMPNAWLRALAAATFMVLRPKFPHQTFAKLEDALAWATSQVRSSLPPRDY